MASLYSNDVSPAASGASFNAEQWEATLESISASIGTCGSTFETHVQRFSEKVDAALEEVPDEDHDSAIALARRYHYQPQNEAAEAEAEGEDEDFCIHHVPYRLCPDGCSD